MLYFYLTCFRISVLKLLFFKFIETKKEDSESLSENKKLKKINILGMLSSLSEVS